MKGLLPWALGHWSCRWWLCTTNLHWLHLSFVLALRHITLKAVASTTGVAVIPRLFDVRPIVLFHIIRIDQLVVSES